MTELHNILHTVPTLSPEICNKSAEWLSYPAVSRCGGTESHFAAPLQRDATPLQACHPYGCFVSMAGCQARLTNLFAPERRTPFETSATREAFLASTTPSDPLRRLKSPTEPTISNTTSDAIAADDDILNGKGEEASPKTSKNHFS